LLFAGALGTQSLWDGILCLAVLGFGVHKGPESQSHPWPPSCLCPLGFLCRLGTLCSPSRWCWPGQLQTGAAAGLPPAPVPAALAWPSELPKGNKRPGAFSAGLGSSTRLCWDRTEWETEAREEWGGDAILCHTSAEDPGWAARLGVPSPEPG